MGRFTALTLVFILWAGIYLPGLGSLEIKGEEGRRILPAQTMLQSGQWVVPYVGGVPYLRKPPLINWLIAGSFKLTGVQNEWSARLPSVLSLLLLAGLTVVLIPNARTGLIAAIFSLTFIGIMEKGRLAEIEGLYVALSGVALLCWYRFWTQKASAWLLWLAPSIFLGLGLLAKAPLHLLFYYAVTVAVLWKERKLRLLLHPAHWLSLFVMIGIFALWALPYFEKAAALNPAGVWGAQFAGRLRGEFDFWGWISNIPRGLSNLLPWVVFAPLLWMVKIEDELRSFIIGTRWAVVLCFFGLLILPGILPRYTLPLVTPLALILAEAVQRSGPAWREMWRRFLPFCKSTEPVVLALGSGVLMVVVSIAYAALVVPRMREDLRPIVRAIEEKLPENGLLQVLNPGYMPMLFYFRQPFVYVERVEEVAHGSPYLLVRKDDLKKLKKKRPAHTELGRWKSRKGQEILLLKLGELGP